MLCSLWQGWRPIMTWVRSHRALCVRLALLALAVQLLVSFGHVHVADLTTTSVAIAATDGTSAHHKPAPSDRSHRRADHYCPICATVQLAGTSVPPTAPMVLPPVSSGSTILERGAGVPSAVSAHLLFSARAPPLAWHRSPSAMSPSQGEVFVTWVLLEVSVPV